MATLVFDGQAHTITLKDRDGKDVGIWLANNVVTRTPDHRYLPFIPNGDHSVATPSMPRRHGATHDSVNGEYGSYGAVVMNRIQGHVGVAVHSGRANVRDRANRIGVNYATQGCIRTTDEAMAVITQTMHADPIHSVSVRNNYDQHNSAPR